MSTEATTTPELNVNTTNANETTPEKIAYTRAEIGRVIVMGNPNENNAPITIKISEKGTTYGTICVRQVVPVMRGRFAGFESRVAFIPVGEDQLDHMANFVFAGQDFFMKGQLIHTESHTKSSDNHKPKSYPTGHKQAGQPILSGGLPVYRNTEFTTDMSLVDVLLPTDNAGSVNFTDNSDFNTPE